MFYISAVVNRYDGFVVFKKDNGFVKKMGKKIQSAFFGADNKGREEQARCFVKELCPTWFQPQTPNISTKDTVEESIDCLEELVNGVKNTYLVDAHCFSRNEANYMQMVRTFSF